VGTVWVRHAPASAAIVRRAVSDALHRAGASDSNAFDGALIASELVSNAVRHAPALPSGQLRVTWSLDEDSYTISVTDGGGLDHLSLPTPALRETSGRGLRIVAALAADWGVIPGTATATVWARGLLTGATELGAELPAALST
jgi:anti-sigma regulatory factor (Ser/Thr protein kinase)